MIYALLPIKYKLLTLTNPTFHIMFSNYYKLYLDAHANYLLELMEDENVNDGVRIRMAKDAKEIYEYKQQEEEILDMLFKSDMEYRRKNPNSFKTTSIPLSHCQFDFYDYRYENFVLSKLIWNSLKEEFGCDDYDDDGDDYINDIITRDAMGGMEFYTMPNGTVGLREAR